MCVLGWRHQSCLSDGGTCRCVNGSKTRRRPITSSEYMEILLFITVLMGFLRWNKGMMSSPIGFFCGNEAMMSSLPLSNRMSLSRCCNAPSFLFTTKRNTPSGTKLRYEVDTSGILHISPEIFKMFPDVSVKSGLKRWLWPHELGRAEEPVEMIPIRISSSFRTESFNTLFQCNRSTFLNTF